MIHTVRGFDIVNEAEVDVFLEFSCFVYGPMDGCTLISGSSAFLSPACVSGSSQSLYCWSMENFEHYFASFLIECNMVFEIVNYFWRESSGSFVYIVFYNLQSTFTYISTFDQSVPLFSKLWLQILPPSYWLCLTQAKWTQGSNHYAVSLINRVKPVWAIWPNTVLSLIETYFVWIMWSNASVCIIFQKIVISALEQLLIHFWIYNI